MIASYLLPAADTCRHNLLAPKWLLAPSRRIGIQWKDQLNLNEVNTVNVHTKTLKSLVLQFVSATLAETGMEFASEFHCSMLSNKVLTDLLAAGELEYFHQVNAVEQLADRLTKTLVDIRLAGLGHTTFQTAGLESSQKSGDLKRLFRAFARELKDRALMDYADCVGLALSELKQNKLTLPNDLIVISPVDLQPSTLEKQFLSTLIDRCQYVAPGSFKVKAKSLTQVEATFNRTIGEINEVQLVFQTAFDRRERYGFDQIEILHTDYSTYVPLIHEQLAVNVGDESSSIDDLPVTFGEGLACIYSRPGRALRSWVRWRRGGFLQSQIVLMIREGLIHFPTADPNGVTGFTLLAHRLRELPIGFGSERYKICLADAIKNSQSAIGARNKRLENLEKAPLSRHNDFGKLIFEQLSHTLGSLIDLTPSNAAAPKEVLAAAKSFLKKFARSSSRIDNYAKQKLLNDVDALAQVTDSVTDLEVDVWALLEQLPVDSRILASGPMPGRIHVDHIARGGHSGRKATFVVGLDDTRFPFRGGQDPLLLDLERRTISTELPTVAQTNMRSRENLQVLINRLNGDVSFSYATYSLADDREQFPSTALLETFRTFNNQPTASLHDFETVAGTPVSFCPNDRVQFVSDNQWWQARLNQEPELDKRNELIHQEFPHLHSGHRADLQRASALFTQYDGLVPLAGDTLDPTGPDAKRTSPSKLETFGACPRKFFLRYGLGIYPPDEHVVDNERWLDALQLGSLIHDVFEHFLRDLTQQERVPQLDRDFADLKSLLHAKIETIKSEIPIPNQDAYQRQLERLEKTCEIFLRKEESYYRETNSIPWVLEASIGLGDEPQSALDCIEPVSLTLSDGRVLSVGGKIDRIDKIGGLDTLRFGIWDYKSGSTWGFDQANPFQQGRKLQPFLYAAMLRHRLVKEIGTDAKPIFFGYFFPSPSAEGQRLRWTSGELKTGDALVSHICDAISAGAFLATNDSKDCGFCQYLPICGTPTATCSQSLIQLETCPDTALDPMRSLREIALEEEPPG